MSRMLPMRVDYDENECKGILRHMELTCYRDLISAMRALGPLTENRRRILENIRIEFGIDEERHRSESRRAANDEHLYTIAERLFDPNATSDWHREGHRPLRHMTPRTISTEAADLTEHIRRREDSDRQRQGEFEPNKRNVLQARRRKHYTVADAMPLVRVPRLSDEYLGSSSDEYLRSLFTPEDREQMSNIHYDCESNVPMTETAEPVAEAAVHINTQKRASIPVNTNPVVVATQETSFQPIQKSSAAASFASCDLLSSIPSIYQSSSQLPPPEMPVLSPNDPNSDSRQFSFEPTRSSTVVIPSPLGSTASLTSPKENLPSGCGSSSNQCLQLEAEGTLGYSQISVPPYPGFKSSTAAPFPILMDMETENLVKIVSSRGGLSLPPEGTVTTTSSSTLSSPSVFSKQEQPVAKVLPKPTPEQVSMPSTENLGHIPQQPIFSIPRKFAKTLPVIKLNLPLKSTDSMVTGRKITTFASDAGELIPQSVYKPIAGITTQSRNEEGLVRGPRYIPPPVGYRFPHCYSAPMISEMCVSNPRASTGLRIVHPSGLPGNPTPPKSVPVMPNVILIRKQPIRSQAPQQATFQETIMTTKSKRLASGSELVPRVISSSLLPLPSAVSVTSQETISTTKHKKLPSGSEPTPRAISSVIPPAVSTKSVRIPESSSVHVSDAQERPQVGEQETIMTTKSKRLASGSEIVPRVISSSLLPLPSAVSVTSVSIPESSLMPRSYFTLQGSTAPDVPVMQLVKQETISTTKRKELSSGSEPKPRAISSVIPPAVSTKSVRIPESSSVHVSDAQERPQVGEKQGKERSSLTKPVRKE